MYVDRVGVGLVGSAVIKQLASVPALSSLKVVALQNSRKTLLAAPGQALALENWQSQLENNGVPALSLEQLVTELKNIQAKNQRHIAVVDNTSNSSMLASAS